MSSKMVEMIKFLLDNPKQKRPKYTLTKVKTTQYQEMGIV